MTDNPEPDRLTTAFQDNHAPDHQMAQSPGRFDPDAFRGFTDLLGRTQALFWLNDFRDGLQDICVCSPAPAQTTLPSRACIHHLCGRAGIMGFNVFHEACLGFLEAGAGHAASDAACQRLRTEAELVLQEIARQRASLA